MFKYSRFIFTLLFIFLLGSCMTTVDKPATNLRDYSKDFESIAMQNITYDPYADRLYFNEDVITSAYVKMINDFATKEMVRKGTVFYDHYGPKIFALGMNESAGDGKIYGYVRDDYILIYDGRFPSKTTGSTRTYADLMNQDKGNTGYSSWGLSDFERKYMFGWNIEQTGPAKSVAGFQYYELPLELSYFVAFADFNNTPRWPEVKIEKYTTSFNYRLEDAVTLQADAKKDEQGQTQKIEQLVEEPVESKLSETDTDVFEQIKKLDDLYKAGILTEEEYNAKKAELLKRI